MASDLISLLSTDIMVKVSSTLDKSVGKKNIIDNNPETCWTSQQGLPQYVQLRFSGSVIPKSIHITFQGGFVGTKCAVQIKTANDDKKDWQLLTYIYPEDVNRRQSFELTTIPEAAKLVEAGISNLKLLFEESSDFFGRITIYDLKLEGMRLIES